MYYLNQTIAGELVTGCNGKLTTKRIPRRHTQPEELSRALCLGLRISPDHGDLCLAYVNFKFQNHVELVSWWLIASRLPISFDCFYELQRQLFKWLEKTQPEQSAGAYPWWEE